MAREMKDSGVEWIGNIPKGWSLRRLQYILKERNEKNTDSKTNNILSLTASKGVIPYSERESGGNKHKDDITSYKIIRPNDIVINSMNVLAGSVGLSRYFGCSSPVYYMLFSEDDLNDIRYYNYIFQSTAFQKSLRGLGNGIMIHESENGKLNTIRMRIPMEKLNKLLLPLPPLFEQQKIADFLDEKVKEIDNAIEKTKETIELYKKYKQAIITEAVTKGLDPNAEMKDSGVNEIGDIPKKWKMIKIRNIGIPQNGISKSGEFFGSGYPFISYSDVYKNISLPQTVNNLIKSSSEERIRYSVRRGDIFFTRTSETTDEVGLSSVCLKTIKDATFAGFLIRVRPNDNLLVPEYSRYYFRNSNLRNYLAKEMNLVTRASLGQNLLKNMPVILPDKDTQLKIVYYLDDKCSKIDHIIHTKVELISKLEACKKSFIYEYVTGKKEVE